MKTLEIAGGFLMRKFKRCVSLFFSFALVMALLQSITFNVNALGAVTRTKQLNLANVRTDISNTSEKWSWDALSKVLTLNGIDFNVSSGDGIILPPGATLQVTGLNTVKASQNGNGILSKGGLTISGSGDLNIRGSLAAIQNVFYLKASLSNLTAIGGKNGGITCKDYLNESEYNSDYDGFIDITLSGSLTASGLNGRSVAIKTGGDINVNLPDVRNQGIIGWLDGVSLDAGGLLNISGRTGDQPNIDSWSGLGKIQLSGTIPSGVNTMIRGNGEVPEGKTLVNNGTLRVMNGFSFTPYGSLANHGKIIPGITAVTATKIYVNGIDILHAPDHTVQCGIGSAVFNPVDNTLTLTNTDINETYTAPDNASYGIYADSSINLVVIGKNTINGTVAPTYGIGISNGTLNVRGTGYMDVTGDKAGVYVNEGALDTQTAIYASSTGIDSAAVLVKNGSTNGNPLSASGDISGYYVYARSYPSGSTAYWTYPQPNSSVTIDANGNITGAAKQIKIAYSYFYYSDYNYTVIPAQAAAADDSKSTAFATLSALALTKALEGASSSYPYHLKYAVFGGGFAKQLRLSIPQDFYDLVKDFNVDLTISTDFGTITLDRDAIISAFTQSGGSGITLTLYSLNRTDLNTAQQNSIGYLIDNPRILKVSVETNGQQINLSGKMRLQINWSMNNYTIPNSSPAVTTLGEDGINTPKAFDKQVSSGYLQGVSFTVVNDEMNLVSSKWPSDYSNSYSDVDTDSWYYEPVREVSAMQLMYGTSPGVFSPANTTTRGMVVTILYRMEGQPYAETTTRFSDVSSDAWYAAAVSWAAQNGIVFGVGDVFKPNDIMTREQMVTVLYRYAQYKGYDLHGADSLAAFSDRGEIQSYALPAMQWSVSNKIISGYSADRIGPLDGAQRAQLAAIFQRFITNITE